MNKEEYMDEVLNGKYIVKNCYACVEVIFHNITRRQAMKQMQKHWSLQIPRIYKIQEGNK